MTTGPGQDLFVEAAEGEDVLSLRDVFRLVRSRGWVIALAIIVAVGIAVGFDLLQTPKYEATVRILIGQESGIVENPANVQGLQDLTQTMAQAARARPVAEEVIQRLNLNITPENFLKNLSAKQVTDTQFIQVSYRDPDPQRAQSVANTVGDVFSARISDVSPSASAVTATVWERAAVPEEPASPNLLRDIPLALALGTVIGVGLAFLLDYLDDSWRSPEEAERVSGKPTFAIIPEFRNPKVPDKKKKKAKT